MIFEHGYIHCDAHPGNILVRPNLKDRSKPQVVLLDHGLYCKMDEKSRLNFGKLWYALNTFDYKTVKEVSYKLGINEYYRYLPMLFTYRTINSKKPMGNKVTLDEINFLKDNDEINLEKFS